MMAKTDYRAQFNYTNTSIFHVIELPYRPVKQKSLSMFVFLPVGNNLTAASESLNAQSLSEIDNSLTVKEIHVYLPRFNLESQQDLPAVLSEMGMPAAFKPAADFSIMDPTRSLFITEFSHKAIINVNEEGTEAAAASEMIYMFDIEPYFLADHPFLFIVQDRKNGNILFIGRVMNPNEKKFLG